MKAGQRRRMVRRVVVVVGRFLDQLFPQLVLLLLLVECLDNTLLLLLDGLLPSSASAVVNHLPARIVLVVLVTRIAGTIILNDLCRIQPHSLTLQPILVSLLAECLNHALLLLLDRWLRLHHLLVLDNYVHRMVRIARRIVLNNLLRMMVVRAII